MKKVQLQSATIRSTPRAEQTSNGEEFLQVINVQTLNVSRNQQTECEVKYLLNASRRVLSKSSHSINP